jgi:phosphoglucosamine mutase
MQALPQVLRNVPVPVRGVDIRAALADEVAAEEAGLGQGRVLLRPSGTEPLVRVMVEHEDEVVCREVCEEVAEIVSRSSSPCAQEEEVRIS